MSLNEFLVMLENNEISLGYQNNQVRIYYYTRSSFSISFIDIDYEKNSVVIKVGNTFRRINISKIKEVKKIE